MTRQLKCGHCPLGDDCRPCHGQRNPRICYRTDPASGPDYFPHWGADQLDDRPLPPVAAEPSEADLLIVACDYRLPSAEECGCSGQEHCAQGKGADPSDPHAVSHVDCRRCVGA
jgi:hypothetical protein